MEPVELNIDELLLRPWRPDDADAVYRACLDPTIQHWAAGLPLPYRLEDAARFVAELAPAALAAGTGVNLGVFDAGTGELLGSTALDRMDRDTSTAEIGYWSAPWARGRRVTERASRALLRWGFDELGVARVDWRATVGNHASRLTGLRLGFDLIGTVPGEVRARDGARIDRWIGSLLPGGLTAADHRLPTWVRRRAHVFGAAQPTLPAVTGPGGVRLRPPDARDLPGLTAACQDPEAVRWTTVPDPYTEADSAWFVGEHTPAVWARGTGAVFVIADSDDAYTGTIDLRISPVDPAVADVGFLVSPHARGRGLAGAALRTLAVWGFEAFGLVRVEWKAHLGNTASRRVAEKAGLTIEGIARAAIAHRGERRDCWTAALLPGDVAVNAGPGERAHEGVRV